MKRLIAILFLTVITLLPFRATAREYAVNGPQGGLSMKITLPKGFDTGKDRCHMVILMHGIFSSKDYPPMPNIAKALAKEGIASVRFDFDGHGKSEGRMIDMTIANELADAKAIWEYVSALPYVTGISLLGHSQGGVIASMTAGDEDMDPQSLILLAPGSVIKEATQDGHFFGNSFDPGNPPEYIKCFHHFKLGRNYLLQTQELDIYGVSGNYRGPVCIIHGSEDGIVPLWCSEKYDAIYQNSEMHVVQGENHLIIKKRREVIGLILDFLHRMDMPQRDSQTAGGYSDVREPDLEEYQLFRAVTDTVQNMTFTPLTVQTQVVAGINYKFYCRFSDGSEEYSPGHCYLTIFKPLPGQGEARITSIEKMQ